MPKLAPLTKLALTAFISVWSFLLTSVLSLGILVGLELLVICAAHALKKTYKALGALCVFSLLLGLLQYAFSHDPNAALLGALRMAAMTMIFPPIFVTTRLQDIATALVSQCHVPYTYAFMFIAALRFIPDFQAESAAIMDAQQCRGLKPAGRIGKISRYAAILEPLLLGAISRSEAMAMSMEMRGFGRPNRSFYNQVALKSTDYGVLVLMLAISVILIYTFLTK